MASKGPVMVADGDPRPARRQARFEEILAAAWDLAAEQGLAGVSLHEVARRVGLRQPSLYAYIDSKAALYDAMFGQAARRLLEHARSWKYLDDARLAVRDSCLALLDFMVNHPPESQLLFERTIPNFEPSPDSYAYAQEYLTFSADLLRAAGVTDPGDVDIFVALIGGLFTQQQTNEPGGDRWARHLDTVLAMLFAHVDGLTPAGRSGPIQAQSKRSQTQPPVSAVMTIPGNRSAPKEPL